MVSFDFDQNLSAIWPLLLLLETAPAFPFQNPAISFLFVSTILVNLLVVNAYIPPPTITTETTESSATTIESLDAGNGGKFGNPGAQIRFSTKTLDAIYAHATTTLAHAIKSMVIPDVIVPIGGGMLTIKSARLGDVKLGNFTRQLLPPNRIRSRLTGSRLASIGEWQYRPINGARQYMSGVFRVVVVEAELNVTNQLGRTWDAKPMVQTSDCKAYLGQFRVEIEGFGENTTVIDQCNNLLCLRVSNTGFWLGVFGKGPGPPCCSRVLTYSQSQLFQVRSYFEDSVCSTARNYVSNHINMKLSTFPTRTNLGPSGNRFALDYSLLMNEPKVTAKYIQAYLEVRGFYRF